MKKKIMTLLMATIMVGGLLTGCGGENGASKSAGDKEAVIEENKEEKIASKESKEEEIASEEMSEDKIAIDADDTENIKRTQRVSQTLTGIFYTGPNAYHTGRTSYCTDYIGLDGVMILVAKVPYSNDIGISEETEFTPYLYAIGTDDDFSPYAICTATVDGNSVVKLTDIDKERESMNIESGALLPAVLYCEADTSVITPDYCAEILTTSDSSVFIPFSNNFNRVAIGGNTYMTFRTYNEMIDADYVYYTVIQDNEEVYTTDFDVICDTVEAVEIEKARLKTGLVTVPVPSNNIDMPFWKE